MHKKIFSYLLIVLPLVMIAPLMTACSNDDKEDEYIIKVEDAIGKWYCVKSTDISGGYTMENLFVGHIVTINGDGTYTSTSSSFGTSGTYAITGNKILVITNDGQRRFVLTVSIKGGSMIWKGSGEGVTFTYIFEKWK